MEPISRATPSGVELVLIAAPAWADRSKEALISKFLMQIEKSVPVCSAVAYAGAPNKAWGSGRPFLQFMCSPAIANAKHAPLVITQGRSRSAYREFARWVGKAKIYEAGSGDSDRLLSLFFATAVHCEALQRTMTELRPGAAKREQRFAAETLLEAFALLETHDFSARNALEACLTPRGLTRQALNAFFVSEKR